MAQEQAVDSSDPRVTLSLFWTPGECLVDVQIIIHNILDGTSSEEINFETNQPEGDCLLQDHAPFKTSFEYDVHFGNTGQNVHDETWHYELSSREHEVEVFFNGNTGSVARTTAINN